jgi:hypothetical protein
MAKFRVARTVIVREIWEVEGESSEAVEALVNQVNDGEMSEDDVLTDAELIDTEPQELSISEDALEFIGE